MSLKIYYSNQFKKDLKLAKKQCRNINKVEEIIQKIADGEKLPHNFRDHALRGNYIGFRECHIEPDWLLIYKIDENEVTLTATRTGSHSYLFK